MQALGTRRLLDGAQHNESVTDEQGNVALAETAARLIAHLQACRGRLQPIGDTEHMQHREFAGRARLLAIYLEQALQAAAGEAYPPSFALLRAALEHRVFDRLLFLASVHEDVIENVSDDAWVRWQAAPPEHLHRWERRPGNKVYVVWKGVRVLNEDGSVAYMLSIYWKWWKDYDPFVTPGRSFDGIAAGHPVDKDSHAEYAKTQHDLWSEALSWKNLKTNLVLNELALPREVAQLDVHHRFLSAFVHPFSENVTDDVYHPVFHGD